MGYSTSNHRFHRLRRCFTFAVVFLVSFSLVFFPPYLFANPAAFALPLFEAVLFNFARREVAKDAGLVFIREAAIKGSASTVSASNMRLITGLGLVTAAGSIPVASKNETVSRIAVNPVIKDQHYLSNVDIALAADYPRSNPSSVLYDNAYSSSSSSPFTLVDPIPKNRTPYIKESTVNNAPQIDPIDTSDNAFFPGYFDFSRRVNPDQTYRFITAKYSTAIMIKEIVAKHYATQSDADTSTGWLGSFARWPTTYPITKEVQSCIKGSNGNEICSPIQQLDHVVVLYEYNTYLPLDEACASGYTADSIGCNLTVPNAVTKPATLPCQPRLVGGNWDLDAKNPNCSPSVLSLDGLKLHLIDGTLVLEDINTGRLVGITPISTTGQLNIYEQTANDRYEMILSPADPITGDRTITQEPVKTTPLTNYGVGTQSSTNTQTGSQTGSQTSTQTGSQTNTGTQSTSDFSFCSWAEPMCKLYSFFTAEPELPEVEQIKTNELNTTTLPTAPTFTLNSKCPSPTPITINLGLVSKTFDIPYDRMCQFLDLIRPFVILAAYLHAAFIISSLRRSD